MGRYSNAIPLTGVDPNFLAEQIGMFMTSEGFSIANYQGKQVWKKGMGILTGPQYLMITFTPQAIVVEAFIKFALLPGVYFGEMGIDGFMGALPKANLAKRVRAVENYLYQLINRTAEAQQSGAVQPQPQPPAGA